MLGKEHAEPNPARDEAFSARMREWRAPEPRAGFEEAVWRRIRSEAAPRSIRGWGSLWDWLLPHPVLAGAATAAVALVLGALAGVILPGRAPDDHALLRPGTVAGTYLDLSNGRIP